jgi:hypothetical protein
MAVRCLSAPTDAKVQRKALGSPTQPEQKEIQHQNSPEKEAVELEWLVAGES